MISVLARPSGRRLLVTPCNPRSNPMNRRLASLAAALALGALTAGAARAEDKVDFGKQIFPIFKESCLKCHGAEKQKAKLALHTPELIMKGSKEGPIVV